MSKAEMLARFAREADMDCFLVAGCYSLLDQSAAAELMPAVEVVLVGCRSAAEVEENARAFATPIPGQLWADLKADGLLPAGVTTPLS